MTPVNKLVKGFPWVKYRRMLGLYSAFYLGLHLFAYIQFYLVFDWPVFIEEVVKRPYITVGAMALLLMLPLVFTSTRAAQKKLGRKWKKLHQSVYLISILGIAHYIWQSKSDLNEPFIYTLWLLIILGLRLYWWKKKRVGARQKLAEHSEINAL